MTEDEAIKEIRFNMSTIGLSNEAAKRVVEARDMAINALEKQIAKKPKEIDCIGFNVLVCPVCKEVLYLYEPYCDNCGQAIDWSDEE